MLPKLTKQQILIASALSGALAFAFGLGIYAFRGVLFPSTSPEDTSVTDQNPASSQPLRHPLTGAVLTEPLTALPQTYAVMIDHSSDAWPQSGIDKAFLVIEAPVESGIPRLEAFFSDATPVAKIGPVRSARPYFVDWANELDALYAHVGGSPAALDLIASSGTFDLNEFSNGASFWRATDRYAPHNAYTSIDLLHQAVEAALARGRASQPVYGTWMFQDGLTADERPKQGIDAQILFSSATYRVQWIYNETSNRYQRIQSGLPFLTADGDKIQSDNVVVVQTDMEVLDAVGRRFIRTTGEGPAFLFQNGSVIQGTWKKPTVSDRLRFYTPDHQEVTMNAGKTWIEVIEKRDQLTFPE